MSSRGPRRGRGRGRASARRSTGTGRGSPANESDSGSSNRHVQQGERTETPNPSLRGGDRGGRGLHHNREAPSRELVWGIIQQEDILENIAGDSNEALVISNLPPRPDFGTDGKQIKLCTNFFPVRLPQGPLYDYHVGISPMMVIRRMTKRVFHLAEQTAAWRQAGMSGRVAHDCSSRLISAIRLPQPLTITVPYYDEDESGPHEQGGTVFIMWINYTQEIDIGNLTSYLSGEALYRDYNALPAIAALNIILMSLPDKLDIMVGRKRYFSRTAAEPFELGGGIEAWKGFYSSIRPAYKQLMVRVSICTTAFRIPGNLARAMIEFRESSSSARMNVFLRGLRVRTTHLGHRKTVKAVAPHTAQAYSLDTPEYGHVTVEDYFRRKYNIRLQYPGISLVDVGGTIPSYLPAEVCDILPGQPFRGRLESEGATSMVNVARRSPNANVTAIVNQVRNQLRVDMTRPELRSFGVTIGPDMAVVPGRILSKPSIQYSSSAALINDEASWNIRGVKFAVGARLENWAVVVIKDGLARDEFTDSSDQDLHWVIARFCNMCNVSGMHVTDDPKYAVAKLPHRNPSDPLRQTAIAVIRNALLGVNPKPTLFLIMLASGDKAVYDGLKHLCDISLDVATICVQSSKFRRSNPHYLANVVLKVNMKLGGVRETEYPLFLEAFKAFSSDAPYRPKLAIIICGRRHHVRFYSTDVNNAGRDVNPLPGTVVDRDVTAIYGFDFFLQSHGGLQGTARPIHYRVIHDEIGFKADQVQGLTNSLSYMFARATKAVRLTSPAYYAEVACQRGRCYLRKLFLGYFGDETAASGTRSENTSEAVLREAQRLWNGGVSRAGLKDTMFYL